jgi:O-6-methylguanine DNA methyltransferase
MYIGYIKTPIGLLQIKADEQYVLTVQPVETAAEGSLGNWVTRAVEVQLEQYFSGERRAFDLPLRRDGTPFQQLVWQELVKIPYGETRAYSDIAVAAGKPRAYRAVGSANRLNSLPIIVPCHRVVAKGGDLAGYALGVDKKAWLLNHERER